jgi:S-DNA-T family DNA segregation ATPase FtsK/SpoIIIE
MARKKPLKKTPRQPLFDDLSPHAKQAILSVLMGVCAVFFLFALFEAAGPVGRYTDMALRFLFGSCAWLVPLACFSYIYVLLNPRENQSLSISKTLGTTLLFLSLFGGLELYEAGYGGVIGLSLVWPLSALLGVTLTGVLFGALILISVFLLFNTGLRFSLFGRKDGEEEEEYDDEFEDEEVAPLKKGKKVVEEVEEEDEATEKTSGLTAVGRAVAKIAAATPSEIVVKNFSGTYVAPSLSLLKKETSKAQIGDVKANSNMIKRTLHEFGISVEMDAVESGPTITRYALKPAQGVRIARIAGLQQELQLALKASSIRIEAPIPGKSLVGIEVPNQTRATVGLASMLATPEYTDSPHPLIVALGKDVTGNVHFANVARMPHGLIAGTTGSGKSVSIHNIIISLLFRNSPDQLRFILVDPKRVELTLYNKIPHLLTPVITDAKKAIRALSWAVKEMERRYDILETEQVQNITSYHKNVYQVAKAEWEKDGSKEDEQLNLPEALPYIVIVLDELNDLMQAYPRELESCIVRLAQMSRAVGIHLILATQRPSVNVITGTIKANVPTRIALAVASQIDSRTIIDGVGAEKLLGAGDMLYLSSDSPRPFRLQSAYVSEDEIKKVVEYLRKQDSFDHDTLNLDETQDNGGDSFFKSLTSNGNDEADDELYDDAKQAVLEAGKASTSYLQRKLRVGYSRAARLIDLLEENGVIGAQDGSKAREITYDSGSTDAEETDREL